MVRFSDRARALAVALMLVVFGVAGDLFAQREPPPSDPKAIAHRTGEEALVLHGQGRFEEAYAKFETADRIAHSPVFVLWMARSKRAQGRLLAAKDLYRKVIDEPLSADASSNWTNAQKDAAVEAEALAKKIPKLVIELASPTPRDSRIELDGKQVNAGRTIEVDPGEHVVRATATGASATEQRLSLEEGSGLRRIQLVLEMQPANEATKGPLWPGGVALGVGLAALTAGGITGAYALVLADEVKDGCIDDQCRRSDEGKAEDANTLAHAGTWLLVGGAACAVAGVVLLIVRPGGEDASRAALVLGPAAVRFDLRF
jgi:hypothetical protein